MQTAYSICVGVVKSLTFVLGTALVLGLFLVGAGTVEWLYYSGGSSDNFNSIGTSMAIGWSPTGPSSPTIQIGIQPQAVANGSNALIFVIQDSLQANTTFAFNFISPFHISGLDYTGGSGGHWSYRNMENLGSVVYYNYTLPRNLIGGFAIGNSVFYFTNLPNRQDHGVNTIFLPFGGSFTPQFSLALKQAPPYSIVSGRNFEIDFDIPLTDRVTNSFPPYVSTRPELSNVTTNSLQSLEFILNDTSGVSITYENPTMVSSYALAQNLEFFCFGLGAPFVITSAAEILKTRAEEKDRKASQANQPVTPRAFE